jgi:hypothetical protein
LKHDIPVPQLPEAGLGTGIAFSDEQYAMRFIDGK